MKRYLTTSLVLNNWAQAVMMLTNFIVVLSGWDIDAYIAAQKEKDNKVAILLIIEAFDTL